MVPRRDPESRARIRRAAAGDFGGAVVIGLKTNLASQILLAALCASFASAQTTAPSVNLFGDDKIRLIVRADDFGFSHASNMALEKLCGEGVITAASVIVNTGWLDETVEILRKHPQVSVGVHVCLNSEWVPYKWGPVLPA